MQEEATPRVPAIDLSPDEVVSLVDLSGYYYATPHCDVYDMEVETSRILTYTPIPPERALASLSITATQPECKK